MSNQSTIDYSNPSLTALSKEYGMQLRELSREIGFRKEYQISPYATSTNEYGLSVIRADRHGNVTYDGELMHGTLEQTRQAISLLLQLGHILDTVRAMKGQDDAR
ncbi:MAG: hypothetical protein ABF780_08215 [Bifidobacterium aquikefiri]|uniref:Uncharacterized protein n=1 Tax=Bifidobacterium aquikefiri TaxID=1653207 RepID=A0A261G7T5_9BIFI|nr:hypothetical protein [Bifidobacterium aquikefiri]OZG67263.1 hypothetical protein BAQU_1336 [Bifidobacterium aquikefiri]